MSGNTQVFVIADYGIGDPAFVEVHQRIAAFIPGSDIQHVAVYPFNGTQTGFWAYQLALNAIAIEELKATMNGARRDSQGAGQQAKTLIFMNTAPRRDSSSPRGENEGEGIVYARLKGGVEVVGVNSGETFSFLKPLIEDIRQINFTVNGSQFRSRDDFPQILAAIADGDYSSLGKRIPIDDIKDPEPERIAHVDGYGNIKLTSSASKIAEKYKLMPGDTVKITVIDASATKAGEKRSITAIYTNGIFNIHEGEVSFASGSSGPKDNRFIEISKRLGNAWKELGKPEVGSKLKIEKVRVKV